MRRSNRVGFDLRRNPSRAEPLEPRLLLATITGNIYEDLNENGVRDAGDARRRPGPVLYAVAPRGASQAPPSDPPPPGQPAEHRGPRVFAHLGKAPEALEEL